jgi:hypothetical protein
MTLGDETAVFDLPVSDRPAIFSLHYDKRNSLVLLFVNEATLGKIL